MENHSIISENVLLIVNTDCICRLCLRTGGALSDIFDEKIDSLILTNLALFTNIDIKPDDNLPLKICHRCRYMIETCCEFRLLILQSNKILLQTLNESNVSNKIILQNPLAVDEVGNKIVKRELFDENDLNTDDSSSDYDVDVDENFAKSENVVNDKMKNASKQIRQIKKRKSELSPNTAVKIAISNKPLQCLLCLDFCEDEDSMKKHVDEHIVGTGLEPYYMLGESNITCKLCSKSFNYRFNFLIHQREHLSLKPFRCNHADCVISFYSKSSLRQHLPIHADRNFICSICAVGFKRKSDLTAHEKIHEDAGIKYKCPLCGLHFKTRFTRAAHLKKHQEQRKYKCTTCLKEYFSQSELRRHEYVHLPDKCFPCNQCSSSYYSRSALARHAKIHHSINKIIYDIECLLCKQIHKVIPTKICMQYLQESNANEFLYTCTECGKGFFDETCFNKHTEDCVSRFTSQLTENCIDKGMRRSFSCDPFSSSQLDALQL